MGITIAEEIGLYIIIFLYGIVIGSFVNVLIYRLPKHENIAVEHSHCMSCGHKLGWYDLVPLLSYIFLKGKCRYCKAKISLQYPLIEAVNGVGYVVIFYFAGLNLFSILYALTFSVLVAVTVIDWRTYEIPPALNIVIAVLGVIMTVLDRTYWASHLIGAVCVSGFLLILFILTQGRGIGGGDIKLMAAAGLLLGWRKIIFALVIGCIIGSIIHLILMKIKGKDRVLAFGPYLSVGIVTMMIWGDTIIKAYLHLVFGA